MEKKNQKTIQKNKRAKNLEMEIKNYNYPH